MEIQLEGLCPLIQVFDMRASLGFYRDVLGFQVTQRAPDTEDCEWCLLCRNGMEIMLNAQYERDERPGRRDAARATAHGDTAFYVGCRDLDAAYLRLCAQGVPVDAPVVTHYGMKQLMLRDPDGYGFCLQWRAA
ncbi:VOC family protein [Tahibacter sp.]|uniref:VOC family protein n=1 Tax=Tahibacter sp. TaxID=2056211 RepID=UPI0028C414C1|nr:VOC family protein [Tahibacter sp.]